MDIEFAKTLYFRELDRSAELDNAPTFRVAILALVAGLFTYYADHFKPAGDFLAIVFMISSALAIVFAALGIAWIIRSYARYKLQRLPHARYLAAHYDSLVDYYHEVGDSSADPERLFEASLRRSFVEAASENRIINDKRSELIYKASTFVSVAVIFSLAAGVPVMYQALASMLR